MPLFIGYLLVFFFFCGATYAQVPLSTALSLAPPPTDGSMVYLANVFGTVEGVIASSGSQIFGHLMGVFNLIVLALGSIVIMYTLVVGTLNTAHEGEFLGKHWSSIWLPVRATVGMTLLVPKTSGFCLMQVLVMWVVVQGVGAADKVWNEALDYLNMGGRLIATQSSSDTMGGESHHKVIVTNPAYNGAAVILTGQVCAYMLQKQLEKERENYLALANPSDGSDPQGPCAPTAVKTSYMKDFCDNPVPDFLSSFNAVNFMSKNKDQNPWKMPIPYLDETTLAPFYGSLNGYCGSLQWSNMKATSESAQKNLNLTDNQADSINMSRGIATQQMIDFLQPVARAMVDNNPVINKNLSSGATAVAFSQYGVALNNSGVVCNQLGGCYTWGAVPGNNNYSILFAGSEFYNAIKAYDGVMQPMLELGKSGKQTDAKKFIQEAKQRGWIYAGGYFFDLIRLSGDPQQSTKQDNASDLDKSTMTSLSLCGDTKDNVSTLCQTFGSTTANTFIDNMSNLISGIKLSTSNEAPICSGGLNYNFSATSSSSGYVTVNGANQGENYNFQTLGCSSTTLGYIGNTYFLSIPGEPDYTINRLTLPLFQPFTFKMPSFNKPHTKHCRGFFCVSMIIQAITSVFTMIYSFINQVLYNAVMLFISTFITVMFNFVFDAFSNALNQLRDMSLNPIVNIANIGAAFIQTASSLGVQVMIGGFQAALVPFVGTLMFLVFLLGLPFISVWMSYFYAAGFVCAYYVPLYPYMLFLFGSIAWLMAVIESMVAAPIVALGIMSPEGEGILGKSETGMMILVNVFLRPSMMIVGFIMGTVLTYVAVWMLNFQFDVVARYLVDYDPKNSVAGKAGINFEQDYFAQIFGFGTYIAVYVGLYTTVVQKSFGLIFQLPDKVLRWISSQQESFGQEVQHWSDESKQKLEQASGQAERSVSGTAASIKESLGGSKGNEEGTKGSIKGG